MADEFNNDATNQRRQLDLIQQQIREQQLQQLQQQQMMRMQAANARMQQMQQQMATQIASSQAQMAAGGPEFGYGSSAAAASAGVQGMSFGSLAMQGFIGPGINQMTGGLLFPNINYSPAFTRDRMREDLQGELRRRFVYAATDFTRTGLNVATFGIHNAILRRSNMAFLTGEFTRSGERSIQAGLEYLRGGAAGDDARADGMGVRIDSDLVVGTQAAARRNLERLNRANRLGISVEDAQLINETAIGAATGGTQLSGDLRGLSSTISSLQSGILSLSRNLQANVEQTTQLVEQGRRAGLGVGTIMAMGATAAGTANPLGLNNLDRQRYMMNVASQARGAGFSAAFGQASLGLAGGLMQDAQAGRVDRGFLARFGGENVSEQAVNVARNNIGQQFGFARRTASSLGVARAASGRTPTSLSGLMSSLGASYVSDPFAGVGVSQDRSQLTRGAITARVDAFNMARMLLEPMGLAGDPRALAVQFGTLINEDDPVIAREEVEALMSRLTSLGGDMDLLALQEMLRAEGLHDADPAAIRDALGGRAPDSISLRDAYNATTNDSLFGAAGAAVASGDQSREAVQALFRTAGFGDIFSDVAQYSNVTPVHAHRLLGSDSANTKRRLTGYDIPNAAAAESFIRRAIDTGSGNVNLASLRMAFGDDPLDQQLAALANISNQDGSGISVRELRSIFNSGGRQGGDKRLQEAFQGREVNAVMQALLFQTTRAGTVNLKNEPVRDGSSADRALYVRTITDS